MRDPRYDDRDVSILTRRLSMTTQQPIRIGLIGANIHQGWSPRAHLPAMQAHCISLN